MAINSEGRGSRFKGYFVMDLRASLSVSHTRSTATQTLHFTLKYRCDSVRQPPGTATIRQTASGLASGSSDRSHTKHKKSACFPQIGQDSAKARICPQSPWIPTPPLCPQLFRSHPAGEIKAPLSPPPPA